MNLVAPERLWLLLLVPALAALYAWVQRRRRARAVRFTNVELLRDVVGPVPMWRRHAPAAVSALALAALVVALAGPTRVIRVPKEAATVMLVIDVSASMDATDVEPSRLAAAIRAASDFVTDLPRQHRIGLVAFDRQARLVATPTTDHAAVEAEIERLTLGPGTAAGDAVAVAVDAIEADRARLGTDVDDDTDDGAAIVLLSDGVTTVGRPVVLAAQEAADAGVPVSTISFGTDDGEVVVMGQVIPVPADPDTMAQVAEMTAGKFFEAASGDELESVYDDIGTRVGYETTTRDASGSWLAGGTVVLALALGLGLVWNGRLA